MQSCSGLLRICLNEKKSDFGPFSFRFGPRFVNMSDVYSLRLRKLARSVAEEEGLSHFIREGVYLMASGPCYETPAELRYFRTVGADVVGKENQSTSRLCAPVLFFPSSKIKPGLGRFNIISMDGKKKIEQEQTCKMKRM